MTKLTFNAALVERSGVAASLAEVCKYIYTIKYIS